MLLFGTAVAPAFCALFCRGETDEPFQRFDRLRVFRAGAGEEDFPRVGLDVFPESKTVKGVLNRSGDFPVKLVLFGRGKRDSAQGQFPEQHGSPPPKEPQGGVFHPQVQEQDIPGSGLFP